MPNAMIDIDNTIMDTQTAIWEYILLSDPEAGVSPDYELLDIADVPFRQEVQKFFQSHNYSETVLNIKPIQGSRDAIARLAIFANIYFVSSRTENWHNATHISLRDHGFLEYANDVILRTASEPAAIFKRRIADNLAVQIACDDSVTTLQALTATPYRYLITQSWNCDEQLPSSIVRATNLTEVIRLLQSRV